MRVPEMDEDYDGGVAADEEADYESGRYEDDMKKHW